MKHNLKVGQIVEVKMNGKWQARGRLMGIYKESAAAFLVAFPGWSVPRCRMVWEPNLYLKESDVRPCAKSA